MTRLQVGRVRLAVNGTAPTSGAVPSCVPRSAWSLAGHSLATSGDHASAVPHAVKPLPTDRSRCRTLTLGNHLRSLALTAPAHRLLGTHRSQGAPERLPRDTRRTP
jgi:hypothetical protein